jgi:hypothetical protein
LLTQLVLNIGNILLKKREQIGKKIPINWST